VIPTGATLGALMTVGLGDSIAARFFLERRRALDRL
jgi:hypothetical protein